MVMSLCFPNFGSFVDVTWYVENNCLFSPSDWKSQFREAIPFQGFSASPSEVSLIYLIALRFKLAYMNIFIYSIDWPE